MSSAQATRLWPLLRPLPVPDAAWGRAPGVAGPGRLGLAYVHDCVLDQLLVCPRWPQLAALSASTTAAPWPCYGLLSTPPPLLTPPTQPSPSPSCTLPGCDLQTRSCPHACSSPWSQASGPQRRKSLWLTGGGALRWPLAARTASSCAVAHCQTHQGQCRAWRLLVAVPGNRTLLSVVSGAAQDHREVPLPCNPQPRSVAGPRSSRRGELLWGSHCPGQ